MIETDLDRRLRSALGGSPEPAPSPAQLIALRAALPRRRARRRLAVGSGAALGVCALVLALALAGSGPPQQRVASGPGPTHAPSCVEVAVGGAALRCAASVVPVVPSAASAANVPTAAPARAASLPQQQFGVRSGRDVVVSIPRLAGVTWSAVVVAGGGGPGAPSGRTVRVHVHSNGRSVANLGRLATGRYTLSATAERRCGAASGCVNGPVGWSFVVIVH